MKPLILTFLMCFTLVLHTEANPPVYRHNPQITSLADDVDTAGIVAFSDTASVDTADLSAINAVNTGGVWDEDNPFKDINDPISLFAYLGGLGGFTGLALSFLALLLMIVIVLMPAIIIGLIIYFILRSRKEKYRILEKAMENGRPLPNDFMGRRLLADDLIWRKGIRNIAIGLGFVAFGYTVSASFFRGVGFIILIYGIGQAVIARTSTSKNSRRYHDDDINGADDKPLE